MDIMAELSLRAEIEDLRSEVDKLIEERDELLWRVEEAREQNRQESCHNMQSGTRG